jgi:PAS domain S-box-containing protein
MPAKVITSNYQIIEDIGVPENVIVNWQVTIDMLAKVANVPAALIMRVHKYDIEVFVSSKSEGNVYTKGEKASLNFNFYCETVIDTRHELLVPNALKDTLWKMDPDIKLGMISYCGLPLMWPDGKIFGTICILDNKENAYTQLTRDLMERFQENIQLSLKTIYDSYVGSKHLDAALTQQNEALMKLNKFSVDLSMLYSKEDIEGLIVKQIKEISGAELAIFSEYNPSSRTTTTKYIDMKPGLLDKVVHLLGTQVKNVHSVVSDELYKMMTTETIGVRKTLTEATFGAISPQVGKAIQALLRVDRFIGIAYLIEGKLYGTSLLGMRKDQADPPRMILENYISLAASTLRGIQADEALIQSNNRLSRAQHSSRSGVWDWDIVNGKLDWSPELFELFGLDATTIPTFDVWQNVLHPDDVQGARDHIDQAIREHKPLSNEYRIVLPSGEVLWVDALGDTAYNEQGEPLRMSGICIDITESKWREKELKSAKTLIDSVIDSSPFAMWISDREGMLVRTNRSLRETLNLTDEQLIGKYNVLNDVNLEKQGVMPMVRAVFENNTPARFVIPWKGSDTGDDDFKNVRDLYIDVSIFPILDNHGKLTNVVCQWLEITERKLAEDALAESEEKLRTLYETMSEGIVYEDHDGKIISANPAAERLLGLSFDQMQGRTSVDPRWKAIHADGSPFPGETHSLNVAAKTGKPAADEIMGIYNPKSGAYVWLSVNSTPEFLPGEKMPFRAYAVFRDITDRKRMDDALHESETKLLALINAVKESVFLMEIDGTVVAVNETTAFRFGVRTTDMIGHNIYSFLPPDVADSRRSYAEQVIATGKFVRFEDKRFEKWVDNSIYPVKDETGQVKLLAIYGYDITERKQAEQALGESEARYKSLVEMQTDLIARSDLDGRLTFVNDAYCKTFGKTREELIGEIFSPTVSPEDRPIVTVMLKAIQAPPYKMQTETRHSTTSGIRVLSWDNVAVMDEFGKIRELQGVGRDITDQKLAEEMLEKSDNQYRLLFHEMLSGFALHEIICDQNGKPTNYRFLSVNTAFEQMTGLNAQDILGKTVLEVLPGTESSWIERYGKVALTGEPIHFENYAAALGKYYEVRAYSPEHGKFATLINEITERKQNEEEISKLNADLERRVIERTVQLQSANKQLESELIERKHAEAALREIEEQFRRLSDAAFEAIIIHDGGILLSTNNQYCEMFGYELEELLGKQVMPLTIAPEAMEGVKKMIAAGDVGPYESTGLKKDGTRFPMEIRVREMEYEGRKVRVAAIMDITERKRVEQALQQRTNQLESANKELEAFSYSVSHDLRAPLRGIDGWSQALLEDYSNILDEQAKTYLERVRSETKRMAQLIDDLLQLSRLTSTEMVLEKVSLSDMAGKIAAQLQEEQTDRKVKFSIQQGMYANVDPRLLEIALSNLLGNAFKFTGKIQKAVIEFGQTEIGGQKVFYVRDNGVGFDMALAKKLFGAFQRMHRASEFPGTGIGLTTVQRIVHRHGGRIWAESAINQGATFYFTLEELP